MEHTKSNIEVSIIIPAYNSSRFIRRTITSVLNQTYKGWELLVVDDGSTDNTIEIVNQYSSQDGRIKLFYTPKNSGGPALPKNIGVENAQGEYIAFLDHDDEWLPEKLQKQLKLLESSKVSQLGLVSCFVNIRNNNGKLISQHCKNYRDDILTHLTESNFLMTSSSVIVKRDILKKIGLFDTQFRVNDDWDMWLRIAGAGYGFDFVSEFLVNYISHGGNVCLDNTHQDANKEFLMLHGKHLKLFSEYGLESLGYYFFYKKQYNLSRRYYINSFFSKKTKFDQKIKSFVYIVFTFFPDQRRVFGIIFKKILSLFHNTFQ